MPDKRQRNDRGRRSTYTSKTYEGNSRGNDVNFRDQRTFRGPNKRDLDWDKERDASKYQEDNNQRYKSREDSYQRSHNDYANSSRRYNGGNNNSTNSNTYNQRSHDYNRRGGNDNDNKNSNNGQDHYYDTHSGDRFHSKSFSISNNSNSSRNRQEDSYSNRKQSYVNNRRDESNSIRSRSKSPTRESKASIPTADIDLSNLPKGPKKMTFKLPKTNSPQNQGTRFNSKNNNGRVYKPNPSSLTQQKQSQQQYNSNRDNIRPLNKQELKISFLKTSRSSTIYERVVQVGEGTYGKVYKSQNIITKDFVALKRLRMESEREGFPITAMREIRLLQSFDHPNIVSLLEIMVENKQIYMIFDYADHDLTGILSNSDIQLTDGNRKFLFHQLLKGIDHLHSKRVIHRDIKGSNLLIDKNGILKVADFGLARKMKTVQSNQSPDYTNRVITLWYRPPELLLGTTDYGREVDMWGIGCLLVELFTKRAIFQAQDEIQQLYSIYQVMGTPTFEQWSNLGNLPWFEMLKPSEFHPFKFKELYGDVLSSQCYDLSLKLLDYDPLRRITASDALNHEYFKEYPTAEPLGDGLLNGEWHEFETKKKRQKEREERKLEERKKRKLEIEENSKDSLESKQSLINKNGDGTKENSVEPISNGRSFTEQESANGDTKEILKVEGDRVGKEDVSKVGNGEIHQELQEQETNDEKDVRSTEKS